MELQKFHFGVSGGIPNSALPLLFIPAGLSEAVANGMVEKTVRENGWSGTWVLPVFDYWHYHTTGLNRTEFSGGHFA